MALTDLECADCGYPARPMNEKTLHEGSTVREPGEALCGGCSSRRVLMMRAVDRLPTTLADIKAARMTVSMS